MATIRASQHAAVLLVLGSLVACNSDGAQDTALATRVAATVYAEQTQGAPAQGAQALPTARPTRTPVITPGPTATMQVMLSGERYSPPAEAITAANAGRLAELAWLGYGGSVGFTQPTAARYSPDGQWLAIAVAQGVYLLDAASCEVVRQLADTPEVPEIVFSGDGKLLAYQAQGAVQIWRLEEVELWREVSLEGGPYVGAGESSIALSYDGLKMLRLTSENIEIWDTASEARTGNLPFAVGDDMGTGGYDFWQVAFSPTGEYFATLRTSMRSAMRDLPSVIEIHRTSDNARIAVFHGVAFTFTPDGSVLASTPALSTEFRRLSDGKLLGGARSFGRVGGFAPDGATFATIFGRSVSILRTKDGYRKSGFQLGHNVESAEFSPDGSQLLIRAGTLELRDVETGTLVRRLADRMDPAVTLLFSPDGKMLASRHQDGVLRLWRVADGTVLHRLEGDAELDISFEDRGSDVAMSSSLAFAPNEDTLAIARGKEGFSYWDITNGVHRYSIELNHCNPAAGVAYSADGMWLASIGDGRQAVCLLPITDEDKPIYVHVEPQGSMMSLAISHDGALMAAGGRNGTVWVWQFEDQELLWSQPLHGEYQAVTDLEFSVDGTVLASAGSDGVVRLREARSGSPVTDIVDESFALTGVAFNAAGDLVGVTSRDGNGAGLYDARTGHSIRVRAEELDNAKQLTFSPDGLLLVASFEDGTIRMYGVP